MSYFATHHELNLSFTNVCWISLSKREYLTTISVYPSKDFDFFLSAGIYIMISKITPQNSKLCLHDVVTHGGRHDEKVLLSGS